MFLLDQESSRWMEWLDTCITARAIRYACRHTPHLKHYCQQESLAACQLWLMWSPSKKEEIHQRNILQKGYQKHNSSEWGRCWISYSFPHLSSVIPDALSHKNYETFLSWGNCFYSNLIPLFRLLSSHPACACVSYRSADTTEYSATPPGPNTRW